MQRRITILTSGTRGDVEPLVALGVGLARAGYHVRVVTHEPFRPLVAARGLEFAPLGRSPNDLFLRPEFRTALTFDGHPLRSAQRTLAYVRAARPIFARMLRDAWLQCRETDALIVTLPTTWGDQIAAALDVPCIRAFLQPIGPTAAFPSPLLPLSHSMGASTNRLTHALAEHTIWQPWRAELRRWRRSLGLIERVSASWSARAAARGDLVLFGFSSHIVPCPPDWPTNYHITGAWFMEQEGDWQPAPDLLRVLSGEPPLYVGFGSTGTDQNATFLQHVLQALRLHGRPVLLHIDDSTRGSVALPPNVHAIGSTPHNWLFPRVAAAAHHGGAGTTFAAFRAGIPSLAVPFNADQFFWGRQLARCGVGPESLPHRDLTAERLAEKLEQLQTPRFNANAARLGSLIRAEDGIARAVELIGRF